MRSAALAIALALAACRATDTAEAAAEPHVRDPRGVQIDLHIEDGPFAVTPDDIRAWVGQAQKAVTAFYGQFPVDALRIEVMHVAGDSIDDGVTRVEDGVATIRVGLGERATTVTLARDWVLTHEMVHTALPDLPVEQRWFEEGLATYVEPIARARVGLESESKVWRQLIDGLPQGNPEAGDRGLDRTPTWGRTYWGGALFCLLADMEIRTRTQGKFGLRDALVSLVAQGHTLLESSSITDVLARCDAAIGVPVMSALYAAHATHAVTTDLPALWSRLGVRAGRGRVSFDDTAPDAALRRAITQARP